MRFLLLVTSLWLAFEEPVSALAQPAECGDCCADEKPGESCPPSCAQCHCCAHRVSVDVTAQITLFVAALDASATEAANAFPASPDPREQSPVPIA